MAVNAEHQESQPSSEDGPIVQSTSGVHWIEDIAIEDIKVENRLRLADPAEVQRIAESIRRIRLQIPITVRRTADGDIILVSGLHRLQAVKSLGSDRIPCRIAPIDERTARLLEISENLHRAELNKLERDEQIAEWIWLTTDQSASSATDKLAEAMEFQSAQPEPIESRRSDGRGHRKASGVKAAARELGIDRNEAQRAVKRVQCIEPDVRDAIKAMPAIADSGVELDALANATPDQQAAAVIAVRSGKAKNAREALAQPELGLPEPVPRQQRLPSTESPPPLRPDPLGKIANRDTPFKEGDVASQSVEPSPHVHCIQLEPISRNWDDARMSATVWQLLQAACSAPDAPRAGVGDPAAAAKLTIAQLNLWAEKLQRGGTAGT
jgi:hypothetical protein